MSWRPRFTPTIRRGERGAPATVTLPPAKAAHHCSAHARGSFIAELMTAIEVAITVGLPPVLRRSEQAALDVLTAAPALTVRAVSDAAGLPLATTATALASLRGRVLVTRRRDGRTWLYTAVPANQTGDSPSAEGGDQTT